MLFSFAAVEAGAVTQAGCYRTVYRAADLPIRATMQGVNAAKEAVVGHFQEEIWNHYFLFALIPTSKPEIGKIIEQKVSPGYEVRNLQIRHEVTFVNALIWVFVGGIYNPMTTTVSGDIVKVNTPGT
jgi:hypothetical protein